MNKCLTPVVTVATEGASLNSNRHIRPPKLCSTEQQAPTQTAKRTISRGQAGGSTPN